MPCFDQRGSRRPLVSVPASTWCTFGGTGDSQIRRQRRLQRPSPVYVAAVVRYIFQVSRCGTRQDVQPYVMRLYMIKRQALTSQTVMICICSETNTSFEPYILSLISLGVNWETSSPGAIRLLLVWMIICITAINIVSVAFITNQLPSPPVSGLYTIANTIR
jgi:hypothetical protein